MFSTKVSTTLTGALFAAYRKLVSLLPLRFKIIFKARLIQFGRWIFSPRQASASGIAPKPSMAFRVLEKMASIIGVAPLFTTRARNICLDEGRPENALRFLLFYIKPGLGLRIPDSGYHHASLIQTEDERLATIALLEEQLALCKKETSRNALQIQLFRLKQTKPDQPEIKQFAKRRIQNAMNERLTAPPTPQTAALGEHGMTALKRVKDIFEHHDSRFFLIAGTLLGAIRDKDFIRGDDDIDLGVFADEVSISQLRKMFAESGFYLDRDFAHQLGYYSPEGVLVDIAVCQRQGDQIIKYSYGETLKWVYPSFELMEHEFNGETFFIPDNYEEILQVNFGDWRQKPLFYDWTFDAPNIVQGENMENLIYLATSFRQALASGDRFSAEITAWQMKELFGIDYTDHFSAAAIDRMNKRGGGQRT